MPIDKDFSCKYVSFNYSKFLILKISVSVLAQYWFGLLPNEKSVHCLINVIKNFNAEINFEFCQSKTFLYTIISKMKRIFKRNTAFY